MVLPERLGSCGLQSFEFMSFIAAVDGVLHGTSFSPLPCMLTLCVGSFHIIHIKCKRKNMINEETAKFSSKLIDRQLRWEAEHGSDGVVLCLYTTDPSKATLLQQQVQQQMEMTQPGAAIAVPVAVAASMNTIPCKQR